MRQIINATRIDHFFQSTSRDAQELLPHLVRKLIMATADVQDIRIPAGDAIARPGYDGLVQVAAGAAFVPPERSVWEMGTGDPAAKAEDDYRKRTKEPGSVVPADTTFVFVTPHRWDRKDAWARQKRDAGVWRDVRCLDNVDLETWLEGAPGVARWLARQIMPEAVGGLEDFDLFWREQSVAGFQPAPELLIGGRTEASARLRQWLLGVGREITVQGEDANEAAAFVAAVVMTLPEAQRDQLRLRTLFVGERDALDYFAPLATPHIVVALTPDDALTIDQQAHARGHQQRLEVSLQRLDDLLPPGHPHHDVRAADGLRSLDDAGASVRAIHEELDPAGTAGDPGFPGQAQHLLEPPAHPPPLEVAVGLRGMEHGADVGQVVDAAAVIGAGDEYRIAGALVLAVEADFPAGGAEGIQCVLDEFLDEMGRITPGVHAGKALGADRQPVIVNDAGGGVQPC